MSKVAMIRKSGPFIAVSQDGVASLTPNEYRILENQLWYTKLTFHYGAAAYDPHTGDRQSMSGERRKLYQYDNNGHFICQRGFYPRVRGLLEEAGYTITFVDTDPPVDPVIYTPDWDRIFERFQLRAKQDECLAQIDMHDGGYIDAPPAFGKTHVMAMVSSMYPRAKIDIVAKRKDVVGRIRDLLTRWVPSVGMVGGGKKQKGRVTVYTADSLHHSDFDAHIMLADEGHELMTDRLAKLLGNYHYSRNFAFSATPDTRLDNAHFRMEGIFGPCVFKMSQQEAEQAGLVSPVFVQWIDVRLSHNPIANIKTLVAQKRNGIWRNQYRNQVIAETARAFREGDDQVLILVDTVDHALHLRKLLPEAALCYSEGALTDGSKRAMFIRNGLLDEDEQMTTALRNSLRHQFENREIKLVIATGVWSVGVSFDSLNVLIRADAGASETTNIQLPGRVCRIDPSSGKQCGILIDFNDVWDTKFKGRAADRRRDYHKRGWTQLLADGKLWTPGMRVNRVGTQK